MSKQPELTVIMPVYNVEKYLKRALDHLVVQSDPNFVLLIVNDGSTDKTKSIAQSYQNKFQHFKLISQPNSGLSSARNVGMQNVTTPYFTFHDGDDWAEPNYTHFFVQAFHEHPAAAMVSCNFIIDYENGKTLVPTRNKTIHRLLPKWKTYKELTNLMGSLFGNRLFVSPVKGYTWNKGYKTALVRQTNLEFVKKLAFMEDQIFNAEYLAQSSGFYCSNTPLYHYFQRSDSMVHNFNLKMIPDDFKANFLVWKTIIRSLYRELKNKLLSSRNDLAKVERIENSDRES